MSHTSAFVIDADDASFERLAIAGSSEQPVVVDFWAEWCGPCRTLGPVLEALAEEYAGQFRLVKVDTESAPQTAQQFQVRSIPAVVGIRDREIVGQFVGAQPEAAIRQFLTELISAPDPADHDAADDAVAEDVEATAQQPTERVAELSDRVETNPDDVAIRLELGAALATLGRSDEALETYLGAVRIDPEYDDQAARRAMLALFEVLGSDHDTTREYRAQLAQLLYR